jgi:flagellar basal-body rod protein FlgF
MENALLIGLSRQTTLQRALDVVANNIANLNTTGYKADGAVFASFMNNASDGGFGAADRRINFVQTPSAWHDMSQGPTQSTGNPFDVSINGDGFLVVQTAAGERYTRNGALQLNGTGQLVTTEGDAVLGDSGPIVFQPNDRDIVINPDGTIKVREGVSLNSDSTRGKLRLVAFDNPQQLVKEGSSTFSAPAGVAPVPVAKPQIVQGTIEKSNVNGVMEMTKMIELSRAYTEVANILQQQGDLRKNAIQQLSEVPA